MLSKQQECEFAEGEYLVILSVAPLVMIEEALQVVVRVKESPRFTLPLEEESKSMGDSARMRSGVRPLSSRRGASAESYAFAVLHLSDIRSTGRGFAGRVAVAQVTGGAGGGYGQGWRSNGSVPRADARGVSE